MAHNISKASGKAEMFYYGETPWHGLGTKVERVATSADAIAAAGLGWSVSKQPLYLGDGRQVPDTFATVRSDTGDPLGVVGTAYTPLQNREAFAWFDSIVGEGAAVYHTAGALGRGERVWILAKLPGELVIAKGDTVEQYLLLSNGHDGQHVVEIGFSPVRVVCQNTLTAALRGQGFQRLLHFGGLKTRMDQAAEILGIARRYYQELGQTFQALTLRKLGDLEAEAYFKAVFPATGSTGEASPIWKKTQETLAGLFHEGRFNILPSIKGSVWAAYNSVTELVDHTRKAKSPDARFESILFGGGAAIKQRAFDQAVALVG